MFNYRNYAADNLSISRNRQGNVVISMIDAKVITFMAFIIVLVCQYLKTIG